MTDLIIIGGGELARVVIDSARDQFNIVGFIDPADCGETVGRMGVKNLGGDDRTIINAHPRAKLILGIGAIDVSPKRAFIVSSLGLAADRWAAVVHPRAIVSPSAIVMPGALVLAGSIICSGATIGDHAIINIGAMIDHDVSVGRFVHVAPGAMLGGGSVVEDGVYVGMGAAVRDHTTVRERTMVGMGAVVAKEYEPGAVLVGVPARPLIKVSPQPADSASIPSD